MNRVIRSYSLALFQKIVKIFLLLSVFMFTFYPSVVVADGSVKKSGEELILNKSEAAALGLVVEKITDPSKLKSDATHGRYSGKATADQTKLEIIFTVEISQSSTPPTSFKSVTAGCTDCIYPNCKKWWSAYPKKPCYSKYRNGYTNFGVSSTDRNFCAIGGESRFSIGDYHITITSSKLDYAMTQKVWDEMKKRHDAFVDAIVKKIGDDQKECPEYKGKCDKAYIEGMKSCLPDKPAIYLICAEGDDIEIDRLGNGDYEDAREVFEKENFIKLSENANVVTGENSKAIIDFAKRGAVTVKDLTNFSVTRYIVSDEGITAHTNMSVGEVDVEVDRKYKEIDFSVSCGAVTSSVRGTEFTVKHEESPIKTTISVHSGKVEVKPTLFSEPAKILSAGQQITAGKDHFGAITKIGNQPQTVKNTAGNLCGTDSEFILYLFQSVLERDSKNNEIEQQVYDLENGMSRKEIVIRFFTFSEYLHKKKGGSEAYRDAYQAVLGREPTPEEARTFPRTRPYIMAMQLLDTDEYQNLCSDKKGKEGDESKPEAGNTMTEKDAYEKYIAAYNKLTQLNAENKGDTPEAQRAFERYKVTKEKYEKVLKENVQTGNTQRENKENEEKVDNDSGGSASTIQKDEVRDESLIFLPDDMYEFYKTPAQVTYFILIDHLAKQGEVSNVGSPEIKAKQVLIDVVLHGKPQKISFVESNRIDNSAEVVVEQVGTNKVMLIKLQKIKGKWAIIPDALDGAMLRKKKPNKNTLPSTETKSMTEKDAYERYVAAYNKLTQLYAEGQGDTPEAQRAFEKHKYEKERYENIIKDKKPIVDFDTDDN